MGTSKLKSQKSEFATRSLDPDLWENLIRLREYIAARSLYGRRTLGESSKGRESRTSRSPTIPPFVGHLPPQFSPDNLMFWSRSNGGGCGDIPFCFFGKLIISHHIKDMCWNRFSLSLSLAIYVSMRLSNISLSIYIYIYNIMYTYVYIRGLGCPTPPPPWGTQSHLCCWSCPCINSRYMLFGASCLDITT